MSAHIILRYRGQPVRFTFSAGKSVWGIVPVGMATPFVSEPAAWAEAMRHDTLRTQPEHLTIENRSQSQTGAPLAHSLTDSPTH